MATWKERQDDKREKRIRYMHEQISSGDLVVRQMTASERSLWEERSAAFDEHSTSEERTRRDAARRKRQGLATRKRKRRDASPPR